MEGEVQGGAAALGYEQFVVNRGRGDAAGLKVADIQQGSDVAPCEFAAEEHRFEHRP